MEEKIKIISDGRIAELYIDGVKVKSPCAELHFIGDVDSKPIVRFEATLYMQDKDGNIMLNYDESDVIKKIIKIGV